MALEIRRPTAPTPSPPPDARNPYPLVPTQRRPPPPHHTQDPYNPYNLETAAHHEINPRSYCTMSAHGLTFILDRESDFTPLRQWEREHAIFHTVIRIPFFRKFRRWRAFWVWRRWVRRTTIDGCSAALQADLFLLDPGLQPPLLKVWAPA